MVSTDPMNWDVEYAGRSCEREEIINKKFRFNKDMLSVSDKSPSYQREEE